MTEIEQPPQNGINVLAAEDEDNSKARPADIEQDMREMERRKRVEAIMGSKLFREELERIVDCARESGNAAGILQQLSDIVGVPSSRVGSVFKASTCMLPINDIRGVESMGYAKGEKILRCKLAATFRLLDLYGWTQGLGAQITARLKVDQEYFLVNPYGLLYHEITASSLNKVDMQGNIVEQGTTNFGVNKGHFVLHSVVHAARPDIRCAIYIGCTPVVAISSLKTGLLPLTKDACVLGELSTYSYTSYLNDEEERNKLVRNLGPNSKVMLLNNHGALCCGETIEEAFFAACHIVQACETQLKLLPVGLDNLVLIPEESRKIIYDQSRRPPEDLEKKFAAATISDSNKLEEEKKEGVDNATKIIGQAPKWRVGGAEFEALMRMLDNAGYRTGYVYRHPLIKSEPPKPKNDVELPPAVSSLGYLLEEEELFRQGIWKKGDFRKGGDRSRWLNSPNVYQKVEVLETGTPDPKKITKWVAEGSPTHSTPVRIDDPLQFVPVNTNPKEFKRVQQQIKDNRRADKISAGPQSHILEGVTWDEANRIKDATVSSAGDHVVLMGAASKGIIQRGFQHNATVYKAPYAKNPFDNVTDDELNEYKRTVERKKKSIHGEYTDTDFSESEALSSLQTSGAQQQTKQTTTTTTTTTTAAVSQSEPEDISEHQVVRIQTKQAPVPSQPEVVLSDASIGFINGERSHTATNRKPPTDVQFSIKNFQLPQDPKSNQSFTLTCHSSSINQHQSESTECDKTGKEEEKQLYFADYQENNYKLHNPSNSNAKLIKKLEQNVFFQDQREKKFSTYPHSYTYTQEHEHSYEKQGNGNLSNVSIYDAPYQHLSKDLDEFCDTSYNLSSDRDHHSICCSENLSSKDRYLELLKRNFKICCTPKICEKIFESVLKSKSMRNQSAIEGDRVFTNMRLHLFKDNSENSLHKKLDSPYRTVSHFGFNKPMRDPKPNHKHLAVQMEKEQIYVPLKRSVSYEEIFSSPRYLNLCERCFELVVRLKPELMKCKIKLNNLIDNSDPRFKLTSGKNYLTGAAANTVCLTNEDEDISEKDNILQLTEPYNIFSLELNRDDNDNISKEDLNESAMKNSIFKEKITRMNYSELSSSTNYMDTTLAVNSPTSLSEFKDYNCKSSTHFSKKNASNEIADFDNNGNDTNSPISLIEICDDMLVNKLLLDTEFFENAVKIRNLDENSKKLMSREERSRRKLEFQELWEDHVNFAVHREEANKHLKKNIFVDANKKDFNEQSSVIKNDVEEFKSTLSRITFYSNKSQNSEIDLSIKPFFSINMVGNDIAKPQIDKPKCFEILENDSHQLKDLNHKLELQNFEIGIKRDLSQVFQMDKTPRSIPLSDSENSIDFIQNEIDKNSEKFSPLERTILEKIHINDLNKSEAIFGKIENTIRNKKTPSKLELLIKKQALQLQGLNNYDEKENLLSKSLDLSNTNLMDESLLRSNSFTLFKLNSSTPTFKLRKASSSYLTHSQRKVKEAKVNNKSSTFTPCVKKSFVKNDKKCRNFILENIRNVSIPRQTPRIKRLQCNVDAIIDKKHINTSRILECEKKSPKILERSAKVFSPRNSSSSAVYSFQTKSVRGSPRFWISMSQNSTKKIQPSSPTIIKTVAPPTKKQHYTNAINRTLDVATTETKVVNNVDAEINALGNEIQQIQPRLENYKRKLDDFGNRVSDCINNINECVNTQENIMSVQKKLKDCMKLREYTDEVMCRVQTFSLSETED